MLVLKKNCFLLYKKRKFKCSVGRNGIKRYKKEGDWCTPTGTFSLGPIYFRKDRIKKLNTKIKSIPIKKNMFWNDDPISKSYNMLTYIKNFSSETLFRKDNIYDIILVVQYNINPVIPKKGSAIFIHISNNNYQATKGCIALNRKDLIDILSILSKNEKVLISF